MTFTSLNEELHNSKRNTIQKQVDAVLVVEEAEKILASVFGIDYEKHLKPLYFRNRTLTVSCNSSVVAQEVRLNQDKIITELNNFIGHKGIDRIRYLL